MFVVKMCALEFYLLKYFKRERADPGPYGHHDELAEQPYCTGELAMLPNIQEHLYLQNYTTDNKIYVKTYDFDS